MLINAVSVTAGGGRSYIRNLLRELASDDRGFDFAVLCLEGALDAEEACGIELVEARVLGRRRLTRTVSRMLYEQVVLPRRARRFDLLYCLADVGPIHCATPTVVAIRNLNIYDRRFFDDLRVRTLERLVRTSARRAARVVFPSRAAADQVRRSIPIDEARVRIVPHGISRDAFDDAAPSDPPETRYLFYPAAVEPHKNVAPLVDAVPLLHDPDLQVWIAGGFADYPDYVATVRARIDALGVGDRVHLLGPVPYDRILDYYRGAVAMVFPSLLESFGHPLLEAMLAETPIAASDIDSAREVGGDVPIYFDARDPAAIAAAVRQLEAEPGETRQRIERGRMRAQAFSWKRSVDALCEVFREALAKSA